MYIDICKPICCIYMTESNFSKITCLSGSYGLQFHKICKTERKEGEEYKLMFKICITARKTKALLLFP